MNIKNFHIPIIIVSVIIALISNYGSFVSAIEPFTFLKMDLNSIERQLLLHYQPHHSLYYFPLVAMN